jgi:hypothetical protein
MHLLIWNQLSVGKYKYPNYHCGETEEVESNVDG